MIDTECQRLLLAEITVVHPPVAPASGRHIEEQAIAVGEFIGLFPTFGVFDRNGGERHNGISV